MQACMHLKRNKSLNLALAKKTSLKFDRIALLVTKNNFGHVILWIPFHSADHGHEFLNGQPFNKCKYVEVEWAEERQTTTPEKQVFTT